MCIYIYVYIAAHAANPVACSSVFLSVAISHTGTHTYLLTTCRRVSNTLHTLNQLHPFIWQSASIQYIPDIHNIPYSNTSITHASCITYTTSTHYVNYSTKCAWHWIGYFAWVAYMININLYSHAPHRYTLGCIITNCIRMCMKNLVTDMRA